MMKALLFFGMAAICVGCVAQPGDEMMQSGHLEVAVVSISDTSISVSAENVGYAPASGESDGTVQVRVQLLRPREVTTAWRANEHVFMLSGLDPLTRIEGTVQSRIASPEFLLNQTGIDLQTTVLGQSGGPARQLVRALVDDDYIRRLIFNAEMQLTVPQKAMFDQLLIDTAKEIRNARLATQRAVTSGEQADVDNLP